MRLTRALPLGILGVFSFSASMALRCLSPLPRQGCGRWRWHPHCTRLLALLLAHLAHQVFAVGVAYQRELFPPGGQVVGHLARVGPQAQEVKARPEPRLIDQAERARAGALFKARLHHPDLAHVGTEFAAARHVANARVKHIVHRVLQCRKRVLAPGHALRPAIAHIGPQHASQEEAGSHRLALAHTAVGIGQRRLHKRLIGTLYHHVQQGVNAVGQAQKLELLDSGNRVPGLQQFEHLVKQAALRHIGQQGLHFFERRGRLGVELEAQLGELGRKAHGANDAHRVFAVARGWVADHAQQLLLRVFKTAVVVHHHLRLWVVVHGVDGKVAPRSVFMLGAPDVVAQHPATGVHSVLHARQFALAGALVAAHLLGIGAVQMRSKRGHLNHFTQAAVLPPPAKHHMHDAKAPPDDEGPAEHGLHLLGRGVRGHIKVLGPQAQQQVAHRAANDIGLIPRVLQITHHRQGPLVHEVGVDLVQVCADLFALAEFCFGGRGRFAQQLIDKFFNHV